MKIKTGCVGLFLVLAMVPCAFAGETELTTYYPFPYGEYTNLTSTSDSSFATDGSSEVGIGTTTPISLLTVGTVSHTYPTTPSGNNAIALSGASLMRMVMNDGSGLFNEYVNAYWDAASGTHKYSVSSYATRFTASNGMFGLQVAPSGIAGDDITWTTGLWIDDVGNVSIGTTTSTVQFERPCPTGFTNIKKGNNQLGCMETDEANSGTGLGFFFAQDYCVDNYGGRLPSTGEWYISMANFLLTAETGNSERCDDASNGNHEVIGATINDSLTVDDSTAYPFRCWIPR